MYPSWISRMFAKSTKPSRRQRRSAHPAMRPSIRPRLESLEDRVLLSADNWIAGSGNWNVGTNWSLKHAPGTGDTAIINTSAAATITIQSSDNIQVQSLTTGSNDTLSVAGGSLTVTSGTSTLSGALSMSGGTLTANGSGVSLTAKGSTSISGASLYADNGAALSLPHLTSYTAKYNTFQADGTSSSGTASVLDVSALTSATIAGNWAINAYNGGEVKLTGMTSLNSNQYGTVYINDTGSSTLLDSNVTTLNGVSAYLDGSDAQVANSWTRFTGGTLTVTTGSYSLSKLTDVDGSNLYVDSGGSLALPGLTAYTAKYNTFQADGTSSSGTASVLDVSALKTVVISGNWAINAYNGGEVKLTGMTSLNSSQYGTVYINDTGSSTLLDSSVTSLNGVSAYLDGSDAQVANSWTKFTGGTLTLTTGSYSLSKLTDVNDSSLYVDNGGSLALPGLISYTAKYNTFQADGSSPSGTASVLDVSALKTVVISGNWAINTYNGGELKLTSMTSLNSSKYGTVYINDTGSSTLLDSKVTSLNGVSAYLDGSDAQVANSWTKFDNGTLTVTTGSYSLSKLTNVNDSSLYVDNGGSLALPGLTKYTAKFNTFQADGTAPDGTASVLDVSALKSVTISGNWAINAYNGGEVKLTGMTSLNSSQYGTIYINDTGSSTLLDSKVISLNGVSAYLDGSDAQVANSWTKFTGGTLQVTTGSYSLSKLTVVDGSSLYVDNGGSLALPGLTKYTAKFNTFQADGTAPDGTASVLDVSALKTVTISGNWAINAYNGGEVKLTSMTSLNSSQYGTIYINDTGSSTLLDSNVTSLSGVSVNMDGTDTQVANSWTSFSGGSLTDSGGSLNFAKMSSFDGSLYLSGGAALSIAGNVNNSGTVSVDAGCNLTIGGSYTQTSNGSFDVQIDATQSPVQFGQVVVKGAASLNGYFNVSLVNGVAPPSGTNFPVMTYASKTGTFSSVSGLGTTFTLHVNPTDVVLSTN